MRICDICGKKEAKIHLRYARISLCEECFVKYYLNRMKRTVEKYRMFNREDRIAVAVSGGKDSIALLHAIKTAYPEYDIFAIYIDLGIDGFSEKSREIVSRITDTLDIPLVIYSLKEKKGYTIMDLMNTRYSRRICSACGILKRAYMRDVARENDATVLATGHNLDDVVEIMITLFIEGKFKDILSLNPAEPPTHPSQIKKVKPLIKHYGWENKYYVKFNNLPSVKINCPLSGGARSLRRKRILSKWEEDEPGIMRSIYTIFTKKFSPLIKKEEVVLNTCKICGGPAIGEICSRCKIEEEVVKMKYIGEEEI